jgi:hypothetical protein
MSSLALTAALAAGALAASALSSTSANAVSLILDGGFNAGPVPSPGDNYYLEYGAFSTNNYQGTTIPGTVPAGNWIVLDNNVDVVAPGGGFYGMDTPSGACCSVDLVGTGATGGIYQGFTAAAGTYALTFYYANNFYSTPTAAANVEVGSSGGGSSNILLTNIIHSTSTSTVSMNWTPFTDTFSILTPGTVTLSFDTTHGANSGGVVITDVSLSSVSQTPLPSTWTMLIAGFVGLGFFAYRGTKKNAAATAAA